MTDVNIITINDFKVLAPEIDLSGYDDPTISGMISQASKRASDYLQYTPFAENITNEIQDALITSEGDLLIFPKKIPLVSVSAISLLKGSVQIDLNLTSGSKNRYTLDYTKRNIRYPGYELTTTGTVLIQNFYELRGTQFYAQITYRAGWEPSDLPAVIKEATVQYMRDILKNRYNQSGALSVSQGGLSLNFDRSGKSLFVKEAERLLNPYRRVG